MEGAHVKRKDTTRGPPLRILSLDGGGVRGYSMLIILQELMYRAYVETEGKPPKRDEIPKPCDYFDLIAGTGTGGLIAIMLGRLRLDIETCMDVYVRMTKKVFETDKTIAGIPYKNTLFKAAKLEEAIKQCVAEHTVYEDEGNDGTARGGKEFGMSMMSPISPTVGRSMSVKSTNSVNPTSPTSTHRHSMLSTGPGFSPNLWGNADASLYDDREHRTKTAVTAVYKGTDPNTGSPVLLRSYDSRKEPPPEFNCTIWQAGRATSATGLAFKPIKIGQSEFIDNGAGKYNPSPQVLEEAVVNEYPGREMGIFVSIGTGKRPGGTNHSQTEWWEGFIGGSIGSFAEARRRLIAKIEACEEIHMQMVNYELPKYHIPPDNYVRLNVEVGVGEFGMNEWDRLSDMTIGTRRYLKKEDTQAIIQNAAYKLASIHLRHRRIAQHARPNTLHGPQETYEEPAQQQYPYHQSQQNSAWPAAVELDAGPVPAVPRMPRYEISGQSRLQPSSNPPYSDDKSFSSGRSSNDKFAVIDGAASTSSKIKKSSEPVILHDKFGYTPADYRTADSNAPPRPPKTPINDPRSAISPIRTSPLPRPGGANVLPYPVDDDGPPPVNKSRKPYYIPTGN